MSEIYSGWWKVFLTSNQIQKIKKKMKKSFKKADELKKKLDKIKEKEEQQADNFLDEQLKKV